MMGMTYLYSMRSGKKMKMFTMQSVNVIVSGEFVFSIVQATGVVTFASEVPDYTVDPFATTTRSTLDATSSQNVSITATDLAGNTATQAVTISVVAGTTLTITDDVTTAADIAAGDVTFSFNFSEDVTGFDVSDITVDGVTDIVDGFTGSGRTYTLEVSLPTTPTNDGTLTVTVAAGVATGATTSATNTLTTVMQRYDTVAPAVPVIDAPLTDDTINIADRDAGVDR